MVYRLVQIPFSSPTVYADVCALRSNHATLLSYQSIQGHGMVSVVCSAYVSLHCADLLSAALLTRPQLHAQSISVALHHHLLSIGHVFRPCRVQIRKHERISPHLWHWLPTILDHLGTPAPAQPQRHRCECQHSRRSPPAPWPAWQRQQRLIVTA